MNLKPQSIPEIKPLTGIRGIAAIMVVVEHFFGSWSLLLPELARFKFIFRQGYLGVDLFFILSGFILCYVYQVGEKRFGLSEYWKFLWYRLARIYPNHLVTLLFMVAAVVGGRAIGFKITGGYYSLKSIPSELLMMHAWGLFEPSNWNFPSWSVSAEWFAYLAIFPICVPILRRQLSGFKFLALGNASLLALIVVYLCGIKPPFLALPRVSFEFLAGAMFYGAYRLRHPIIEFCQRYLTSITLFTLAIIAFRPVNNYYGEGVLLLMISLIILGLTSDKSLFAKLLTRPFWLWMGQISFAIYMTHGIVLRIGKVALNPANFVNSSLSIRLLIIAIHWVAIFGSAIALYYLVEGPARDWMRRKWNDWIKPKSKSEVLSEVLSNG